MTSEQDEDVQAPKERMMVQERQDKLLEKLNLDGLSEWTPHNDAIARELLLSYHDAFALEPDELGCTSANRARGSPYRRRTIQGAI